MPYTDIVIKSMPEAIELHKELLLKDSSGYLQWKVDEYLALCLKDEKDLTEADSGKIKNFEILSKIDDAQVKKLKADYQVLNKNKDKDAKSAEAIAKINKDLFEKYLSGMAEAFAKGIDPDPLKYKAFRKIPKGTILIQLQDMKEIEVDDKGKKVKKVVEEPQSQGMFYTTLEDKAASAHALGTAGITIGGVLKAMTKGSEAPSNRQWWVYVVTDDIWGVYSIAGKIKDTWSFQGMREIDTEGGNPQLLLTTRNAIKFKGIWNDETMKRVFKEQEEEQKVMQESLVATQKQQVKLPAGNKEIPQLTQAQIQALTRAQSRWRGKLARKKVKALKEEKKSEKEIDPILLSRSSSSLSSTSLTSQQRDKPQDPSPTPTSPKAKPD